MTSQIKPYVCAYGRAERVYAIFCAALAYLFVRAVFFSSMGLGSFIFTVAAVASALFAFRAKNIVPTSRSYAFGAIIIIFSLCYITNTNEFIHTICLICTMFMYLLWILRTAFGGDIITDGIAGDMLCALFAPFAKLFSVFAAIFAPRRDNKGSHRALRIILGLILSAIPCTIVVWLLMAADEAFFNLVNTFSFSLGDTFCEQLGYIIFALPVCCYIFAAWQSALLRAEKSDETNGDDARRIKISRPATTLAAALPLLGVYMAYFFAQLSYFISAFGGYLPDGYSAADYARRGFFELCGVAVINALVIALISAFSSEDGKRDITVKRCIIIALSACTLILIATAISKMALYISFYGLTQKRIYTTWFMLLLAISFILVIIRQCRTAFPLAKTLFLAFALMFALLIFPDYDGITAQYNSSLGNITAGSAAELSELSSSPGVIETLLDYSHSDDPEVCAEADYQLKWRYDRIIDRNSIYSGNILCYNIGIQRSAALLAQSGFDGTREYY
ncbi:MAG: DUF4173 domain-containing protein [Eubacteriales bacterium]